MKKTIKLNATGAEGLICKQQAGRNNKTFGWAVMALLISSIIGSAPLLAETPSQLEATKRS